MQQHDRKLLSKHYPLLLAAMDSSCGKEDIMMTCARALHDAVDVSLVREAAEYLEDVELKKIGN
jgi:A1 cistron-splicing factor AAR2